MGINFNGKINTIEADGAYVKICDGTYTVGASNKSLCARSLMLMAQHLGENCYEKLQPAAFTSRGAMLDLSRGGAMRVSSIKKYLDYMACFGLNTLLLYIEDMYEVKEFPKFGYMRGRYTAEELKEIDDYAYELGIEVVPCIQTLAHMERYLKHREASEIHATYFTLLCDEEKTYEFIDTLIKTIKGIFRTSRIHIGMDEAHDFCEGEYRKRHGETTDKFDVLCRHLGRVTQICDKYELHPMMWDDMFFKIGSKTGNYYDADAVIPDEAKTRIPNVDLVYWDYDRNNEEQYIKLINAHKALGKKVVYAGAFWTPGYQMPFTGNVFKTLSHGLKSCIKTGITDVFATSWGDNGTEGNYFLTLPLLAIISEYCFNGNSCTNETIKKSAEFVTGVDFAAIDAMSAYHMPYDDTSEQVWYRGIGKGLFYTDLLYNLTGKSEIFKTLANYYEDGWQTLAHCAEKHRGSEWAKFYTYLANILHVLKINADIIVNIRTEYEAKNLEYFKVLAEKTLPELISLYESIYVAAENIWMYTNKVFGWENVSLRFGRMLTRLDYMRRITLSFAYRKTNVIEELEFEYMDEKYGEFDTSEWSKITYENNITI